MEVTHLPLAPLGSLPSAHGSKEPRCAHEANNRAAAKNDMCDAGAQMEYLQSTNHVTRVGSEVCQLFHRAFAQSLEEKRRRGPLVHARGSQVQLEGRAWI